MTCATLTRASSSRWASCTEPSTCESSHVLTCRSSLTLLACSAGKNEHNLRRSVDFKLVDLDQRLQQAQHDMEATAEQLRQIRFEQEQARSSTLSQLFRVFQFVLSHTRSGPFFWLLLPVTAPLSAVEFVARKTIDVDGGSGSGSSSSERSGGSWEATEGYSRGKDSGRRLRE